MNPKIRLLALIAALGVAACDSSSTTPSAVVSTAELPADDVIYGVSHVMTRSGIRSAVLDGDTAYLHENGQRLDLKGVKLKFFAENGRETGTLTSKTGEYNVRDGVFVARGNVVLDTQGPEGTRHLETEELHYTVNSDQLWSDVPFVLQENGRTTRGSSFRSDAKFQKWSVEGASTSGGLPQAGGDGAGISF